MGCSNVKLVEGEVQTLSLSPEALFCVRPPKEFGRYLNVLFIIDISGSNSSTDPGKTRRTGAIRSFFDIYKTNPYMNWGLEVFSGSKAKHLINTSEGQNFSNSQDFEMALSDFQSEKDGDATPYLSALALGQSAVSKYVEHTTSKKIETGNFHIIFISDGEPTDSSNTQDIIKAVENFKLLTTDEVKLSTVYYNTRQNNNNAIVLLEEMAKIGKGKFKNASQGEAIDLSELILTGVYSEPYEIKDFFVYNLNSAVCDTGEIGADSDADGLCDSDEIKYNIYFEENIKKKFGQKLFSTTNRYSFDSRFSDLIMYKHIVEGEILPDCSITDEPDYFKDEDFDLLNSCEEKFQFAKSVSGPNSSWEEQMQKGGNRGSKFNFDSDGDGLIDGLEFMFFKNKSMALDFNNLNSRINSLQRYDYIKNHVSYLKPESSEPYKLSVVWVKKNDNNQNCYKIDQENLPIYSVKRVTTSGVNGNLELTHDFDENSILVYYTMTTEENPNGLSVMRFSYQKLKYNTNNLIDFNMIRFDEVEAK